MLRVMWRELETGSRTSLDGHEGGNPGNRQGLFYRVTAPALDPTRKTTLLNEYEITPFDGAAPIVLDGNIGGGNGGYSSGQSYLSMNFQGDRWSGNYAIQIIGEGDDFNAAPAAIGSKIDTITYHYLQGSYAISDSAIIAVGIDNLWDDSAVCCLLDGCQYGHDDLRSHWSTGLRLTYLQVGMSAVEMMRGSGWRCLAFCSQFARVRVQVQQSVPG